MLFDPATPAPRVFALPPGADFPALLVQGLLARMQPHPPEALARVQLFVNSARMRAQVTECLAARGARLLPRIRLVTDLAQEAAVEGIPAAIPPLRRRLELMQLVGHLLDAQPDLAPRAALFDLADSLAGLMDEMQGEGVSPAAIARLDVSNHSAHWTRTQAFMQIVQPFFGADELPDAATRQRRVVDALAARWLAAPPEAPVIVAGSTGSRGATLRFMQAVAALPQGALVLPGYDFDLPAPVWETMADAMTAEDHPQFRFRRLMDALALPPEAIRRWHDAAPPSPARNRLVSLSLRPAPVTDQWLTEGAALHDIAEATQALTLIEAESPRDEALAIALVLRAAAETGRRAALITPDRGLTRQVAAALDRWGIVADDSAGKPLALSAPGRLLRHLARLMGRRLTAETLLTVLKHPLVASGGERGPHLRLTRDLELRLRREGPPFPDAAMLRGWAAGQRQEGAGVWADWLVAALDPLITASAAPLGDLLARHRAAAEALARGPWATGTGALWAEAAGQAAQAAFAGIEAEQDAGGRFRIDDYRNLIDAILARGEVRDTQPAHPGLMIWGTLEARVQGADLVVLGGLNDGIWPQLPPPDPWLNRRMRRDAGLLLPERQIGLSAHDYQQAIAAPEVVLTRAGRDADAETVPSRWLNRLVNLLGGLAGQGGPAALAAMRARGAEWLHLADALERPAAAVAPAHRPAPRPPVAHRPRELALTRIETLIRDPYAIYARYILRLKKLDPLHHSPDARLRGTLLHEILETFVRERPPASHPETRPEARARLLAIAAGVLGAHAPWPAARALWLARLDRAADFFLDHDGWGGGQAVGIEETGRLRLDPLDFTLYGTPDRIDALPDGRLHVMDYKTGTPPTKAQQDQFAKQLLLAACMAEGGGFRELGPREVARITYIGLNSNPRAETTEITPDLLGKVWQDLHRLIGRYLTPGTGYAARRAVFESRFPGDYDHLSRFGEWEMTDRATPEDMP